MWTDFWAFIAFMGHHGRFSYYCFLFWSFVSKVTARFVVWQLKPPVPQYLTQPVCTLKILPTLLVLVFTFKNYVCIRGLLDPDQLNVFWTHRERNSNFSLIHKVPNHVLLGFLPFEEELLNKIIFSCSLLASLRVGKIWCYGWEILSNSFLFSYTSICQIGVL